ncbi:MAG TPA: pilin [Candidatus Saccharimonadales bacterium]|nr:pilin [Candidatus Saccharimonadales bacterium]
MITTLKTIAVSILLVVAVALPTAAADPKQSLCEGSGGTWSGTSCSNASGQSDLMTTIRNISNVLLFILGTIAVVMVIIGGIRYVTSNGEQNQISSAKDTIMYAMIGLVLALAAYAVVNFVTSTVQKNTSGNGNATQDRRPL